MSALRLYSATLWGVEGCLVSVEVDVAPGLPTFRIVGMPATVVREACERVRAALRNTGFPLPLGRITVNLAPADLPKPHPVFDLAIALGILGAGGHLPPGPWMDWLLLGELSLDGSLRPPRGLLSLARVARREGRAGLVVGAAGGPPWERAWMDDLPLTCLPDLRSAIAWAKSGKGPAAAVVPSMAPSGGSALAPTAAAPSGGATADAVAAGAAGWMDHIKGQAHAKRALEIAAAGGHGLLMYGPPGTGKSLLARSLTGLLPPLDPGEGREVAEVYSAAGLAPPAAGARPFRDPHHSVTRAALLGGGAVPEPGELTLAHRGVLFLDELPLFRRDAIDGLREPLEQGFVTIHRVGRTARFPARFLLVAAANPCRCGHFGDDQAGCRCTEYELRRYWATLPGPVLDRIDLFVPVGRLSFDEVAAPPENGKQAGRDAVQRVRSAREVQALRYRGEGIHSNAEMGRIHLERHALLEPGPRSVLRRAYECYRLSVRAHDRILRVARTIADLDASLAITREHILEALSYREAPLGWA